MLKIGTYGGSSRKPRAIHVLSMSSLRSAPSIAESMWRPGRARARRRVTCVTRSVFRRNRITCVYCASSAAVRGSRLRLAAATASGARHSVRLSPSTRLERHTGVPGNVYLTANGSPAAGTRNGGSLLTLSRTTTSGECKATAETDVVVTTESRRLAAVAAGGAGTIRSAAVSSTWLALVPSVALFRWRDNVSSSSSRSSSSGSSSTVP
jgi:hypothetical protein